MINVGSIVEYKSRYGQQAVRGKVLKLDEAAGIIVIQFKGKRRPETLSYPQDGGVLQEAAHA